MNTTVPIDLTEEVDTCPSCGSSPRVSLVTAAKDLLTSSPPAEFGIWRCLSCSSTYLSPRPTKASLSLYYPDDYLPMDAVSGQPSRWRRQVKRILRTLLSLPYSLRFGDPGPAVRPFGQGRLLEIGCGHGHYLAEMRNLGWDVYGCDISQDKVDKLIPKFGPDHVLCCSMENLPPDLGLFDIVGLWHVIEHLHEPRKALEQIHKLLKPGGRVIIGTPNVDSWEARLFGRWWIGFEVPRHLVVFSRHGLERLLIDTGFKLSRVRPSLWAASVPDSLAFSLNHRLGIDIWANAFHQCLHYILFPAVALSRTLGNWAIIEITATKR